MRSLGPPPKPIGSGRPRPLETEIHPIHLAISGRIPIWDIRPRHERAAEPGFIPGSRSVPMDPVSARHLPWQTLLEQHDLIALVCLSGRRSEAIVTALQNAAVRGVLHVTGGILAWQGEGFPLCVQHGVEPDEYRTVTCLQQLPRAVLSCFVAESVQSQSDDGFLDPKQLVDQVFAQPEALTSFDRARDALDLLGENARRLGHPIEHIAANLNGMRALVERLERSAAGPAD